VAGPGRPPEEVRGCSRFCKNKRRTTIVVFVTLAAAPLIVVCVLVSKLQSRTGNRSCSYLKFKRPRNNLVQAVQ
jgi:hypothetical protein